jgi:hypothetical protein
MESRTSYSLAVVAVGTALVVVFAGAVVILALGRSVPQELWAAASALSGALVGILIPTPGARSARVADAAGVTKAAATSAARSAAATIAQHGAVREHAKLAAKAAVMAVKAVPVQAKVKEMRDTSTSAEVNEEVIAIFVRLLQDSQDKLRAAQSAFDAGPQAGGPDALALQTEVEKATATQTVHAAAAAAATDASGTATEIAQSGLSGSASGAPSLSGSTILLLVGATLVLIAALALAMLISSGTIHAASCPIASAGKTQSCDSNMLQIGTAVLALASAAGGTILGLFATPDGKPPVPSAASKGTP